jgi:hypothetical protein
MKKILLSLFVATSLIACNNQETKTETVAPTTPATLDTAAVVAKIKGMESYEFERREYPHPRSPEALVILAKRWGVVVGSDFAEAFCLIRSIN